MDLVEKLFYVAPIAGVLALIFAFWRASWVESQDAGSAQMKTVAGRIKDGAMAFLAAEYRYFAIFVVLVAGALAAAHSSEDAGSAWIAGSFVIGATASGLAGYFGMSTATTANVRTTQAATKSLPHALAVAFSGGTVIGMCVVGLALVGLCGLWVFYDDAIFAESTDYQRWQLTINVITGFAMGASTMALFARVAGGIYERAADVGAELASSSELGLRDGDPRNPAAIAENVGDNVGDVAGMGADLFESYVGAIVAAMVLALGFTATHGGDAGALFFPLVLAGVGIVCSIAGTFFVRTKEGGQPQAALDVGAFGTAGVMAAVTFVLAYLMWPRHGTVLHDGHGARVDWIDVALATVIGLAVGVSVALVTSYYRSRGAVRTGSATSAIAGLGLGMQSTAIPIFLIALGVLGAAHFAGLYGIALAALGMLSTTGVQLAVEAYGPIADNAGGIAQMTEQEPAVRERTDKLEAVSTTTSAIGRGFAISSAAMTALALFAAFAQTAHLDGIDIGAPAVMAGIFIGGMLPYLFSSMAMRAVAQAASELIEEVRRQFREIKGLAEGSAPPDTARYVDLSTRSALRRMLLPGLLAIATPVIVGFALGAESLGGLLLGVIVSGVLLAIFMSSAGRAWEKGSAPFKDTTGPSLNVLMKLMAIVALVIAPLLSMMQ